MPTRRHVLAGLAFGSVSLGGCLSAGESKEARISDIALMNLTGGTVNLTVTVSKDDSVVLDESYTLAGDSGSTSNPATVIEQEWMNSPGRFELTIESSTMEESVERTIPDRGEGCYAVIIRVGPTGQVDVPMDANESC